MVETRRLHLLEVTPESWAPFGRIPSDEGTEHDDADLEFLLNDGHANFIAHDNGEIQFSERGGALCELLNRHDTHTQTLMPVDVEAYVVVAPAETGWIRSTRTSAPVTYAAWSAADLVQLWCCASASVPVATAITSSSAAPPWRSG